MGSQTLAIKDRREWTKARDVQQRFMSHPAAVLDSVAYSAKCRQMHELGGDYYDFVPFPEDRLALTVGDASGKGLPAALMISCVQSSLRTAALFSGNEGAAILRAVNRHVYATSLADRYATLFYGVFDGASRTLRYVNAGHPPPMIMRRDGSIAWLEAGGAPVGMFPDWKYEEGIVQLLPGDVVVAYTDGVIEAESPFGEMWGVEGLEKAAAENRGRCAEGMVHAIFQAMDEFSHGIQTDDATVAVLSVN